MAIVFNIDNFRKRDLLPPESEIQERVRSIDIGTRNFALSEEWRLKNGEYRIARGMVVDLKGDSASQKLKEMMIAIDHLFNLPELAWFWNPDGVVTICESQMDHLKGARDDGKKKKRFKPPIMYALQAAIICQVLQRCPQAQWPDIDGEEPTLDEYEGRYLGLVERQTSAYTMYQDRSGKQKYGLEKYHHDERKTMTLTVAPETLEAKGDLHGAAWLEFVPKGRDGKPREDVCDSVLQGIRWLEDQEEARQKAKRKLEREQKRKENPATKKRTRPLSAIVILDASSSEEDEVKEPPPKKQRTV